MWAGPENLSRAMKAGTVRVEGGPRTKPVRLKLGFAREDFSFAVDLGMPGGRTAFALDPAIKRECIWTGPAFRPAGLLIDRNGPVLRVLDEAGAMTTLSDALSSFESVMTAFADPKRAPELALVRGCIQSWRFYDHLRTDADAPARSPQVGTYTPVLDHDGSDAAAALQTIREIGDSQGFDDAIADAFPGSSINVDTTGGRFGLVMHQPEMLRPLAASELSDGTLRYILLVAALLTPRPPELLVLNEPETSLHPDLIAPLARLIVATADRSQVIVVSHNDQLTSALARQPDASLIRLCKTLGETVIDGQSILDRPLWHWPER